MPLDQILTWYNYKFCILIYKLFLLCTFHTYVSYPRILFYGASAHLICNLWCHLSKAFVRCKYHYKMTSWIWHMELFCWYISPCSFKFFRRLGNMKMPITAAFCKALGKIALFFSSRDKLRKTTHYCTLNTEVV